MAGKGTSLANGVYVEGGFKYAPKSFAFTITDAGTGATQSITTGPEINYAGTAASGHFAFSQSFSGWVRLETGDKFRVGADDTGSVSVAGITASAPAGEHAFQWGEEVEFAGESGWYEASAEHSSVGGPFGFHVEGLKFYERTEIDTSDTGTDPADEDCECTENCDMRSSSEVESISFTQPFGRTPFASGFKSGKLLLKVQYPDRGIYSPAFLAFDHYLTRRASAVDFSTQAATISADGLWENVYENGVPASDNAWKSSSIAVSADGCVVEKLVSGAEISYDSDGNFASVKSASGLVLTAVQLGAEVIRDASGALRQIWSLADGLLDIVADESSPDRYEIRWYKPASVSAKSSGLYVTSGAPVKVFACGKPEDVEGNCAFEIVETRGTAFSFRNLWVYEPDEQAWTLTRGDTTITRAWVRDETSGHFVISETRTSGTATSAFTEEVSPTNGNRNVGKTVGGVAEYSATRVASGNGKGKIASETDRSGATRNYEYDTNRRVARETLSSGFGGLSETTEYAYAEQVAGTTVDLRPRSVVRKIAGTVFKTETFVYNDDETAGRTETHSVAANGTTLTRETRYYPSNTGTVCAGRVRYEIRADGTATHYEFSETAIPASVDLSSNLGYTQTETEGVWTDGAFAVVAGKSTRVVRTFDTRGNEIRTENYVHTGTAFELISWEEKTYSPTHKLIASTRSDGKTASADYICTGAVWTIDENGVRTDNTFDEAKRMKTSTRRGARGDVVTTYVYDAEGRVIAETQTAGTLTKTTSRNYDAFGELASETDALGNTTTYTRSNDGLTETVTFPDGGTRTTVRNAHGETLSVSGTAVVAQYYAYGFENGLKTTTVFTGTQNGSRWEKTYADGHGRTVKTERPGFGENVVLTTENTYAGTRLVATESTGSPRASYTHDALGNVVAQVSSIDSAWRKTETEVVYEKDSDGIIWQKTTNVVSCSNETVPAQTTISKTQLSGLSLALESKQVSIDVRGNATTTTSSYDLNTKTRTQTTAFPQMTDAQTSVSVDGAVVSQSAPGGVNASATYDAFNRKITSTDARGNATTYVYDAGDRLVSQTQTLGDEAVVTAFEYDAMNRQTKTTFADGTFVASAYDPRGNKLAEYGNASYPVLFTYDELNQKTRMETFRTLAGTPEELANLTGGDATIWSYDAATGLLLSKTDAAGMSVNYTYTAAGLLASRTWARGVVTNYAYDAWNQLASTTYSDETPDVSQTYDVLGRVVSVADAAGTRATSYAADGNVSSESFARFNATQTPSYDAFGREIYTTLKQGDATIGLFAQSYDAASGRIASGAFGNVAFDYSYLAGTRLVSEIAVLGGALMTKKIAYESVRDLPVEIAYEKPENVLIAKRNYSFDTLGRVSARTQTRGTATPRSDTFGYNARSELTSATLGNDNYAYAFDNIGNRSSSTETGTALAYSTNNLNQYTEITKGEATFLSLQYDADGNATLVQTSTGTWAISYNGENRPIRFENAATQTVVECVYDSQGRRFEKKVTVAGTLTLRERYLYRGYLQIAAFDVTSSPSGESTGEAESTLSTQLLYTLKHVIFWDPAEPVATRPLAINIIDDGIYFPTTDLTKNVCELVDAYGDIAAHYDYAPFGAVSAGTPSGTTVPANPLQWSSEVYDPELDLVYYNYRHYSPALGRFLSRDPIQEQGGWNLYAFVENAITQKYDVLGRSEVSLFLFKTYLSRAILGEPSEPIIFSDINNEMKYASQSSIWSELKKYLSRNAQRQKKRQKIQLSELNIASLTSNRSLAVTTNDLHLTVSSSSTVLVSGDLSFCVSDEGVAFDMDGTVDVAWVDEMDANSFREFYYKEIKHGEGWSLGIVIAWLIEGSIDLLGDSLLGANFDFVIHYQIDLSKFS